MHVLRRYTYLIIDQLGAKVWAQSAFPSPKTVQLIMNDLAKFIILHLSISFNNLLMTYLHLTFFRSVNRKYSMKLWYKNGIKLSWLRRNTALSINLYGDNFPDTRI